MATHSSILAWRILCTEEPGGLLSIGSYRVGHDWSDLACMHACIGEGNGNPLQYSCLANPKDRGAWWAAIYGVMQSWTRLKPLSSSSSGLRSHLARSTSLIEAFSPKAVVSKLLGGTLTGHKGLSRVVTDGGLCLWGIKGKDFPMSPRKTWD